MTLVDSPPPASGPASSRTGSATDSPLQHHGGLPGGRRFLQRPVWNRFTPLQTATLGLASIPPVVIFGAMVARLFGFITETEMIDLALGAGENPGTIIFGAMFLASPMQWSTGRSQVRVRKFLGIVFYLLALSNGAMFAIEEGLAEALGSPLLVAGSAALLLGLPLFATSSTAAQRWLGMRRWRLLHKLTYVVAAAIVVHVSLTGEFDFGTALVALGFLLRVPALRRRLETRGNRSIRGCVPTP